LSNALSTTLGQTLANILRIHPGTSNCIIISKREKFHWELQFVSSTLKERSFSFHLGNSVVIKRLVVSWIERIVIKRLIVSWRIFEHKEEGSQGLFKVCKGFIEIVKNLKWVA